VIISGIEDERDGRYRDRGELSQFPCSAPTGDAVLGEELGAPGDSSSRWLFDSIDGASNFVAGSSQLGTHVALKTIGRSSRRNSVRKVAHLKLLTACAR
jgi:fructose-1,6-bisphosphatase/inositol monophosphatase family enzyme